MPEAGRRPASVTALAYAGIALYGSVLVIDVLSLSRLLTRGGGGYGFYMPLLSLAPMIAASIALLRGQRWAQFLFLVLPLTLGMSWLWLAKALLANWGGAIWVLLTFLLWLAGAWILSRPAVDRYFYERTEPASVPGGIDGA